MKSTEIKTIKELLYWSYANLAMSHAAVASGSEKFNRTHFIIRSRLFSGLMKGTMNIGSLIDDEKIKIKNSDCCCYCGIVAPLTVDQSDPTSERWRSQWRQRRMGLPKMQQFKGQKRLT